MPRPYVRGDRGFGWMAASRAAREPRQQWQREPLERRRRRGHHGLVAEPQRELREPGRAAEAGRHVSGVVEALARSPSALREELLEPAARRHPRPHPSQATAVVPELMADVAGDQDRAVGRHEIAPDAVELHARRPLQCLPALLQGGVVVLGQMRAVLHPGVDPEVGALSAKAVGDPVDGVLDLAADPAQDRLLAAALVGRRLSGRFAVHRVPPSGSTSSSISAKLPESNMTSVTTRQRLPVAERRTLIVEAAGRLFGERGYEGTRIDEIAAAAGVTKPIVY